MKLGMGSLISYENGDPGSPFSYDTGSSYILCKHLKHRIMTIQSTSLQQHYNDGHSQHTTLVSEKGCTLTAMHFSRGNSVNLAKEVLPMHTMLIMSMQLLVYILSQKPVWYVGCAGCTYIMMCV